MYPSVSTGKYLTKAQIAEHYGVSPRTIGNWVSKGVLPALKIGRVLRFNVEACDAALQRRTENLPIRATALKS
jgi:excisionase family DNA binding protein